MVKNILTKVVIAVLLLSMLLALAACGGGDDTTTPTTTKDPADTGSDSPEAYPSQIDGMKDLTDGSTVTFLFVEGGNGTYTSDSIAIDETAGDIDDIDEAVIERNNKVEEDLGVYIEPLEAEGIAIHGLQEYAKTWFDMQDDEVDVYCGYQYYDISFATQGHLYNLNTLTNGDGEKIIDTTREYWATNYIDSITYNDYLYWVTGDLSFRYTGGLYCTFVNKTIYDAAVKSSYDGRSIYQVVKDGDWTMETMLDMASLAYIDNDNSGSATEGDRFGIVYETCDILDGIAFGCEIEFGRKTTGADGKDEVSIYLNLDTKATTLAGYLDDMFSATYGYMAEEADSQNMMPIFAAGNALFAVNKIYMATVYLSDMEDYAIVPTPKLNTAQRDYASGVHDSLTIYGISKYSDCPEAAAATLELMAYYGSILVTPDYYEKVMKGGRTVRDDEAPEMIEMIRAGFDSDFVAAWSASIDNIVQVYRTPNNVKKFSNYLRVQSKNWPSRLNTLLTQLEEASLEAY